MQNRQTQSMFDTLNGYENFVNRLLEEDTELTVNPLLDWEDALDNNNFLFKVVEQ